jgi:hypothetical protein
MTIHEPRGNSHEKAYPKINLFGMLTAVSGELASICASADMHAGFL